MLALASAALPLLASRGASQQPSRPTTSDRTGRVRVRVETAGRAVAGAHVRSGESGSLTNAEGDAHLTLAAGSHTLVVRKVGFAPDTVRLLLRAGADTSLTTELHSRIAEVEGVVISATRGERRVEDEPTRVEVLDHEEVEEKTAMSPGSVSHLLSETGGVKMAQTSPAFGAANIRVQGLRGRYTQLLVDGLPLYGLTTEGLGLLQIPPMDLDHVELIKGAASALYGPTAIGGVVNLVSRRPSAGPALHQVLLNQTSRDGTDAVYYGSGALTERWGYTLLTSGHRQRQLDVDGDRWADLPAYERAVVRPRLFWTSLRGSSLLLTSGFTGEDRDGGGIVPAGGPGGTAFAQRRMTRRGDVGAAGRVLVGGSSLLTVRASGTTEWRTQRFGAALEHQRRTTLFGEAALRTTHATHDIVLGAAVQRDALRTRETPALGYAFAAPGAFAQHTWTPTDWFGLTSSARVDRHTAYGTFLSPRVSALLRPAPGWNARLSAGAGGYGPTPFVEETEETGLRLLRPFRAGRSDGLRAERARSMSVDIGGTVGSVEVIGSAYSSAIEHPVALVAAGNQSDSVQLANSAAPTLTRGAEFVAIYRRGAYRVTGTYGYLHATEQDPETGVRRGVALTPRHSVGFLFTWEPKDESGVGLEAFYTGRQPLHDDPYRRESRPFATVGALARWAFGRTVVFVNSENLTDVRQTRYDSLLRRVPGLGGRWTVDAWAPLDGRIINAGMQIRLGRTQGGDAGEHADRDEREK